MPGCRTPPESNRALHALRAVRLHCRQRHTWLGYGIDLSVATTTTNDIRVLPNNMEVICGGGWANGHYGATNEFNSRSSGFMMIDNKTKPIIRLGAYGNTVRGNFYGYTHVSGDVPPVGLRGRAAIELMQLTYVMGGETFNYSTNGHHSIAITATGFETAIRAEEGGNHDDHLDIERLTTHDSRLPENLLFCLPTIVEPQFRHGRALLPRAAKRRPSDVYALNSDCNSNCLCTECLC